MVNLLSLCSGQRIPAQNWCGGEGRESSRVGRPSLPDGRHRTHTHPRSNERLALDKNNRKDKNVSGSMNASHVFVTF